MKDDVVTDQSLSWKGRKWRKYGMKLWSLRKYEMKLWSLAVLQSPYFKICVLYSGPWHVFSTMVHDTDYRNARGLRYRGVRKSLAWQQGSVSNLQLSSHRGVSRWVTVGQRSVETIGSTMEFIYQEEYGGEECISIGRLNASQLFGYTVYAFQLFGYTVS